ncbi:PIG-L deacetylase family protein [Luteimonas saliphila]|uniref:PIG-L deacetylase family protein n=1 Tax=Luteimonas saliphila TaxID=2804919 RepID=UPI00192DD5BF|nr:PIG-L family deacetylase [Luteimonas saliphila]
MAAVIAPRIVGAGHAEADWQASRWLSALPGRPLGPLLAGYRRLVVLSPHPDDETLACGGLMRAAAHAGLEVHLVAATDGEACYPGDADWTPQRLREQRPEEVEQALAALGVDAQVRRLGLPDGGLAGCRDTLERAVTALLGPDDLVLAPWERDGHPDHDALGEAALHVAQSTDACLLQYPVWAWHWLQPDATRAPFDAFTVRLDAQAMAAKRRAIACFASQLGTAQPATPPPILPAHVVERFLRPFEVYLA